MSGTVRLKLPATFMLDHLSRFEGSPEFGTYRVVKGSPTSRVVEVYLTGPQLLNLAQDAQHYASPTSGLAGDPDYRYLVDSAKTTLRSLERQGVTL